MRARFILALGLLWACADEPVEEAVGGPNGDCPGGKCDGVGETSTFEYIVVGSGAGGGPLAANLARAGHTVLLLEAGEDAGDALYYQVPALHPLASEEPGLAWAYYVDHYGDEGQARRDTKHVDDGDRQGVLYPRGGTLGGSTAVNAMITVYPHDRDWDHIADLTGDSSWRAANMRPYFERVERNGYLRDSTRGHGFAGWLSVERFPLLRALGDWQLLKVASGAALGFVDNRSDSWFDLFGDLEELLAILKRDVNELSAERDTREGLFSIPKATRDGVRNGTRERILDTVAAGFPLTVRTRSLVTRVLFEEGTTRARGVAYLAGRGLYKADLQEDPTAEGEPREAYATREVILSAGAFNTPQLLKLSGVGPAAELAAHGIETRVDLPGVGENLQDRYEVGVVFELEDDFNLLDGCTFGQTRRDPCVAEWRDDEGVYPSNGAAFGLIRRSGSALTADPDLFVFGAPGIFKGYYPGYSQDAIKSKRHFTWVILKAHTGNTAGRVTLRSADPRDWPRVNFHYFDEGDTAEMEDWHDLQAVVDGVELAREIGEQTDTLMPFGYFREVWPGPTVRTRTEVAQFVKDEAWGHHASCSARIGADDDPMAVLDSEFRVRGTERLRVVDASVFPRIPGFFIVTPIYMISEKASDAILAAAR